MASKIEEALGGELFARKRSIGHDIDEQIAHYSSGKYLYYLLEPGSNVVRYIGVAVDVRSRFAVHLQQAMFGKSKPPVSRWIAGLVESGELPDVRVVAKVTTTGFSFEKMLSSCVATRALERWVIRAAIKGRWMTNAKLKYDLLNVEHVPAECRSH